MAKKKGRRSYNFKKFSLKRLAWSVAGTAAVLLCVSGIHFFGNRATKDFIEKNFASVIDIVRESGAAPDELVFVLDQVANALPYVYGETFSADIPAGSEEFLIGGSPLFPSGRILKNDAYLLSYDENKKNPAWCAYSLTYPKSFETGKRPAKFSTDARTRSQVKHDDYTGTGFDRGHMAPNNAIGACYGGAAQTSTFLMSNVVPQYHAMNAGVWKDLEQRTLRRYTRNFGRIWIVCGPVYGVPAERFKNGSGIAVPEACFLILFDREEKSGRLRTLSFIVPNRPDVGNDARKYIASIDEIEARTGIDFLSGLSAGEQAPLEAYKAKTIW